MFGARSRMESDPTKLGTMKLMGTFGVPSYISFGDEYMKKIPADPRYKGKQLQTNPGHKGVAGARDQKTLFEEKFKMLYEGEKYSQQNYYNVDMAKDGSAAERIKTNPRGFLSKDNAKRDEFSNVTRTAQWRENLGKEIRFTQKGAAAFYKNLPQPTKEDKRMKMLMRRSMSSSSVIGSHTFGPDGQSMLPPLAAKTPFARRPIVRSSFYRRTGVFTS